MKNKGYVLIDRHGIVWGFSHLIGRAVDQLADRPFYSIDEAMDHSRFIGPVTVAEWTPAHQVPPLPIEDSWVVIFIIVCVVICVGILRLGGWI